MFASPVSQDKTGNSGAIVKSSNELAKTTPAGEYLTSALMDFDPDQFEGFAAIADGANKLLMLVINTTPTYIILLLDLLYLLFVATKLVLLLPLYCPCLPLYIFFSQIQESYVSLHQNSNAPTTSEQYSNYICAWHRKRLNQAANPLLNWQPPHRAKPLLLDARREPL